MVWDHGRQRAYPYYRAGIETFSVGDEVEFATDPTDTIVTSVTRSSGSRRRTGAYKVVQTGVPARV